MRTEEFFYFMREREAVRLRKEAGEPWPWTKDEILQTYKFTNVKREHDRTTQGLIKLYRTAREWSAPKSSFLMNAAIYRYFGTLEFARSYGFRARFSADALKEHARQRMSEGLPVFTGAYVITNQGIKAPKIDVVVDHFLTPLHAELGNIVQLMDDCGHWRSVIEYMMKNLQGFGGTGFMSKEVILDTLFTPLWDHWGGQPLDFNTWCPAGPGARRGLNRIFGRDVNKGTNTAQALTEMKELFALSREHWPEDGVQLCLHDIQFQLCEFDKYERVRLGEGKPRSKYRRPA